MKIIFGSRGVGKTRQLLELAKEENAMVVCANPIRMADKAHAYGIIGLNFISYNDYLNSYNEDYNVVIDDLDLFIVNCFPHVSAATITVE